MAELVTRNYVYNVYRNLIKVNNGKLDKFLSHYQPVYCTAGVYGWNADVFDMGNDIAIVQGSRPFGNIKVDKRSLDQINNMADHYCRKEIDHIEKNKILDAILIEFVNKVVDKE